MNLQFEDFYRFVASVGLALIAAAVALPFFLLSQSFGLELATEDYAKLTDVSQRLLNVRAESLIFAMRALPVVTGGLALVGVGALIYGVHNWRLVQRDVDLERRARTDIARIEADERREQRADAVKKVLEIEADLAAGRALPGPAVTPGGAEAVLNTLEIERRVLALLAREGAVSPPPAFGRYNVDALVTFVGPRKDLLVEVKFFGSRLPSERVIKAAMTALAASKEYSAHTHRPSRALVVCVASRAAIDSPSRERCLNDTEHYVRGVVDGAWPFDVGVAFVAEEDLGDASRHPAVVQTILKA